MILLEHNITKYLRFEFIISIQDIGHLELMLYAHMWASKNVTKLV